MIGISFYILVLFYSGEIHGINQRINDGASTSNQASDRELDSCVHCDLQNYASRLILLMTSEDIRGENLTDMMVTRYHELEAFYYEVNTIILNVENGNGELSVTAANRIKRLEYFLSYLNLFISQIVQKACTDHFRLSLIHNFDDTEQMILIRESLSFESNNCLCTDNHGERSMLSRPLRLPSTRRPEIKFTLIKGNNKLTIDETSLHYVIPLPLISRFFQLWLSNEPGSYPNNNFNGCVHTLFGRLKRSMQKILLVSIKKSRVFLDQSEHSVDDNISLDNDNILKIQSIQNAVTWLSGNIFIGPTNRGPFDPTYQRTEEQLLDAFDHSVEPIIGHRRFQNLRQLFTRLRNFVRFAPEMTPFSRLMNGFNIVITMTLSFHTDIVTPMKSDQWEERELTLDELVKFSIEQFIEMRNKKYWIIKNPAKRPQRSVNYNDYQIVEPYPFPQAKLKVLWRKFILNMVEVSMDALSKNHSLDWSCNFTRLFDDYLSRKLITLKDDDCSSCVSFDEFLYSQISNSKDWYECNKNEAVSKIEWCLAWKNIMMNLEDEAINFTNFTVPSQYNKSVNQDIFDIFKLQINSKDIEILINWLSSHKKIKTSEEFQFHQMMVPKSPSQEKKGGGSDLAITSCKLLITILKNFNLQWRDCIKSFELLGRSLFFKRPGVAKKIFGYIF